ncbi:adhesion G protein-coupled receptor B2 [Trichonephila clavipes]|uniref:Adhesion G protein-coupled receptor B2 n=1 Tax=Trichonephila clavipes TaxID=2585209 RepID=A0A8X6VKS1_TRICX|nr:adhesion G protein-coupled receptor B2 [Trichonephila clavipes]
MKFYEGSKSLEMCTNCSSEPISSAHILDYLGLTKQGVADNPLQVLDFSRAYEYDFWHMTATAGSDVVQSGRPIFDDIFQHLGPYIGNNTANVVFQMVKRLWLIRIDQ